MTKQCDSIFRVFLENDTAITVDAVVLSFHSLCFIGPEKHLLGEWLMKDVTVCKVLSVKKSCLIGYVDSLSHF